MGRRHLAVVVVSRRGLDLVATAVAAAVRSLMDAADLASRFPVAGLAPAPDATLADLIHPVQEHRRRAAASSSVSRQSSSTIASCSAGRTRAIALLSGVGWTRLVNSAT